MAVLKGILGKNRSVISPEERDEMEREEREYDQKVHRAIALSKAMQEAAYKSKKKKGTRHGTMHGRYMKVVYGK